MSLREKKHTLLFMSSLTTRRPLKLHSTHARSNRNGLGFPMKILNCENSQPLMFFVYIVCRLMLVFFGQIQSKHVRPDLLLFVVIASFVTHSRLLYVQFTLNQRVYMPQFRYTMLFFFIYEPFLWTMRSFFMRRFLL